MHKDEVFKKEIKKSSDFKFGANVVNVFDDMVSRSVPFYGEIQRMIAEITATHARPGTLVYDLGCSTGNSLLGMNELVNEDINFIGIDDSMEMLDKCRKKLQEVGTKRNVELKCIDLNHGVKIPNASVVLLSLTLQFIRPVHRQRLLKNIFDGLNGSGVLIVVEKILAEDSMFNRDFIEYYYGYKRINHYSELEIAQKREALENVLVPYKLSENIAMLRDTGFTHCEVFFKWYNFAGLIATKK